MGPLKQIDTGGLSFQDIRRRDKFYVDKSMLIADILGGNDSGVYLFTRPRRFGKSTNISMLDAFLNMEYRGNDWFDGLEISTHHEYAAYRNAFPVVYMDLKDIVADDFDGFVSGFRNALRKTFGRFDYLLESEALRPDEREEIESVLNRTIPKDDMGFCVEDLCTMLEKHHGRRAVVLIDEYDRAVTDTFGTDLQRTVIGFLSRFMSSTLKSNRCLQMAYITGVMQVAKSGMFSGVNNIVVNNVLSRRSDERFGFTEGEVRDILDYYGHPEKMDEVREWYDGYRFGDAEVYNPFSVMSYVSNDFEADRYWARSGNENPMRWMLDRTGSRNIDTVADIVSGVPTKVAIHQDMTYEDMRMARDSDLYSLMVMTGYLKALPRGDEAYDVSVPNKEVLGMIDAVLNDVIPLDDSLFRDFATAMVEGNARNVEHILSRLLEGTSYFDLRDESDYKLAVLLCLHGIVWRYDVECERQRGNGRVDIVMIPRDSDLVPIVIELKVCRSGDDLEDKAAEAIRQIHGRRYYNGMTGDVMLYGIAFHGVIPKVDVERLHLRPGCSHVRGQVAARRHASRSTSATSTNCIPWAWVGRLSFQPGPFPTSYLTLHLMSSATRSKEEGFCRSAVRHDVITYIC